MTAPERLEMHHKAARALLYMIDSSKGHLTTVVAREVAIQQLLQDHPLTRMTVDGTVTDHDVESMMSLARGLNKYTVASISVAGLFEHGSSVLPDEYLVKLGYKSQPSIESDLVSVTMKKPTKFLVCDRIALNVNCTGDRSTAIVNKGGRKYCVSCRDWLSNEASHLAKLGCFNPHQLPGCNGRQLLRREKEVLCSNCIVYARELDKQEKEAGNDKHLRPFQAKPVTQQEHAMVSDSQESQASQHEVENSVVEDDNSNPRKTQRLLPKGRADEQGHDIGVVEEASTAKPSNIVTADPSLAGDDGLEEDSGQAETDVEEDDQEDDDDEYLQDELGQEELPQPAAQLGKSNSSKAIVLDALSPQDMDPAPLRSLKSIGKKYHENKSTQLSCDVSGVHIPTLTASQPTVRSPSTGNSLYSSTARSAKRTALDAGSLNQPPFDAKRQRITQKVADELQNSVEYRLRPNQIQKDWEGVFKVLQDVVIYLFNDAQVDTRQHVSLVQRTELNPSLKRLYHRVLGTDMWRISAMQDAGLLTAYHFLMALVGSIVYEVLGREEMEPWLLGQKDERTVYLQKVLEAQSKCVGDAQRLHT